MKKLCKMFNSRIFCRSSLSEKRSACMHIQADLFGRVESVLQINKRCQRVQHAALSTGRQLFETHNIFGLSSTLYVFFQFTNRQPKNSRNSKIQENRVVTIYFNINIINLCRFLSKICQKCSILFEDTVHVRSKFFFTQYNNLAQKYVMAK